MCLGLAVELQPIQPHVLALNELSDSPSELTPNADGTYTLSKGERYIVDSNPITVLADWTGKL